jgi:type IV pilus assembly protein PilE
MSLRTTRLPSRRRGFSLIELMVTIAIGSILLAIAIPGYNTYVRKSRRTDAKTALLDLAGREERYYNANGNQYSQIASQLGYTGGGAVINPVGNGYYSVTLSAPTPAAGSPWTYTLTAVPVTADQLKDSACLYYYLDNTGLQKAGASAAAAVTASPCWQ